MNSKQLLFIITCMYIPNLWALESDTLEQIKQKLHNKQDIVYQGAKYTLTKIHKNEDTNDIHYIHEKPAILLGVLIVGKDVISINESKKEDSSIISIENPQRIYNMALKDFSFGTLVATILILANLTQ